ncbi:MAG: AMP-binding protein, partial [Myxococcota bacterium]
SAILFDYSLLVVPFELAFHAMRRDQPTVVMGVPHFFENLETLFLQTVVARNLASRLRYRLYRLALQLLPRTLLRPGYPPFKALLGGRIRYLWTGSAPMGADTLRFFADMGVPLYQGYGTAETGIVSKNYPGHDKPGSVGKPMPTRHIEFDQDRQILIKSTYPLNDRYYRGSAEDNARVFRGDGFVVTGDTGYIDDDGYLYIDGRIKDLVVFSNGRKVFPTPIEKRLMSSELFRQCVVYGDGRPYLVAVVVPEDGGDGDGEDAALRAELDRLNTTLSPEEQVRDLAIASEPFTFENGLLTSQGKVRRSRVITQYQAQLQALYD